MSSALALEAALDVLCNASQEVLQPHRHKALLALQKLWISVGRVDPATFPRSASDWIPLSGGNYGSSSSTLSIKDKVPSMIAPNYSPGPVDSDLSSSTDERSVPPPRTDLVIESLDRQSVEIKKFLSKSELEAVTEVPEWLNEDPRIVDLQLDGGRSSVNLSARFRKGLSQRSLTIEYNQWELDTFGTSKLDELQYNLACSKDRKSGHITEYVEMTDQFVDKATAIKGINHGIKLLVIERLLNTNSISAILIFGYRSLRLINSKDFDYLTTQLKSLDWVAAILKHKVDWFNNCQKIYDGMRLLVNISTAHFSTASCEKYSRGNKSNTFTSATTAVQSHTGHNVRELDRAECTTEQINGIP